MALITPTHVKFQHPELCGQWMLPMTKTVYGARNGAQLVARWEEHVTTPQVSLAVGCYNTSEMKKKLISYQLELEKNLSSSWSSSSFMQEPTKQPLKVCFRNDKNIIHFQWTLPKVNNVWLTTTSVNTHDSYSGTASYTWLSLAIKELNTDTWYYTVTKNFMDEMQPQKLNITKIFHSNY